MSDDRAFQLAALLQALKVRKYRFVTPTPSTHERVVARRNKARDLRDVFGWSLPFSRDLLDPEILEIVETLGLVEPNGAELKSKVRVSSLDEFLFLHSAYPTTQHDSVFFGPDSYRFAAFLKSELPRFHGKKYAADIGTGSGIGGILTSALIDPDLVYLIDINDTALELAIANSISSVVYSGMMSVHASGIPTLPETPDLIIANPPYIADPLHRAYRDGGDMHGAALSLDWARQAAQKLESGGALLLYTGSAIVDGEDWFKAALHETLHDFDVAYRELDPDVFGEELEREDYADIERIAVVGCVAVKR